MGHHWIGNIFGLTVNLDTLIMMWLAMAFVILFAFISTRKLEIVPNKLQFVCEKIMGFFWGLSESMIGKGGRVHVPLLASLFLFILIANLSGQLPLRLIHLKTGELASPTNDINLTAAMAVIVLIYYVSLGVKTKGIHFIYHGFSFNGIITTLVDLLEMVTRPLSLAIRLFANILAGEILVVAMISMLALFLPLPIMFFELMVACIQAFVFMMLTMAYISSAISNEH